jgi:hypothetical protein
MTETILLVDYENVRDTGLKFLPPHDRALLFVGKEQKPKLAFIQDRLAQETRLDLIQIAEQGRNNLDFYIAFYLGKTMSEEQGANYIVFSNDQDLDPLIAHLKKRGIACSRMGVPSSAPVAKSAPAKAAAAAPQKPAALKPSERKAAAPSPRKTAATKAAEKNSAVKPVGDLESVLSFLKGLGKRRPTTRKKLANHLGPHYRKEWPNVNFLIDALEKHGSIRFTPKEDVEYIL